MKFKTQRLIGRVKRARTALKCEVRYGLGKGGMNPRASCPGDDAGKCDCSGFVAWAIWLSRKPKVSRKWWIETTRIARDAKGRKSVFTQIREPRAGCLIVYGDKGGRQGHIGIVTEVDGSGRVTGIDCSYGMSRKTGRALHERDLSWMRRRGAIYCVLTEDIKD